MVAKEQAAQRNGAYDEKDSIFWSQDMGIK
jgi:hypothetical protein